MDHVFVLNYIIDIYLQKRKRVYCVFIDYKKAFDLVDRSSLCSKLISHGINGKLMSVICNLYHHAKYCIRANGKMSDLHAMLTLDKVNIYRLYYSRYI